MFGVGFVELIIIGVFALVFIGPKRLPEVMRQAGRIFVHLRRTANDVRSTFDQVIKEAEAELNREEAESLRKALAPIKDAHSEVKNLLSPLAALEAKAQRIPHALDQALNHPIGADSKVVEAQIAAAPAALEPPAGSAPATGPAPSNANADTSPASNSDSASAANNTTS